MKITVIGTGYVGLVSGTCLAEVGNDVLCLDVDPVKITTLQEGGMPITTAARPAFERLALATRTELAAAFSVVQASAD